VEVQLYTGVAMWPATSCRLADTCCQWWLALEGVVAASGVVVGLAAAEAVAMKALAF
jgi:hypothetical protein